MSGACPPLTAGLDLTPLNAMGLRAVAQFGTTLTARAQIAPLVAACRDRGLPLCIIGGGSNILPAPRVEGVVARMAIRGRRLHRRPDGKRLLTVAAGENWADLVQWTVGQRIGGFENLAGIPGTVGAAPVQNIGAYGVELADLLYELTAWDIREARFRSLPKAECHFAYRDSMFQREAGRFLIAQVTFRLTDTWSPITTCGGLEGLALCEEPRAVMQRVMALRKAKLPDWPKSPRAGSGFQNPVRLL